RNRITRRAGDHDVDCPARPVGATVTRAQATVGVNPREAVADSAVNPDRIGGQTALNTGTVRALGLRDAPARAVACVLVLGGLLFGKVLTRGPERIAVDQDLAEAAVGFAGDVHLRATFEDRDHVVA